MWLDDAVARIKSHEGLSLRIYPDTKGLNTIGYGHCLDRKPITESAALHILSDDVRDAAEDALRVYPDFYTLSDNRKCVLTDMAFNLGREGLAEFHDMLFALKQGDYKQAALEIIDSELPKLRAGDLARLMEQG